MSNQHGEPSGRLVDPAASSGHVNRTASGDEPHGEPRLRAMLDGMLEGCQLLGHDWRYLYVNPAAERHNRRPSAELLGRRYMDAWPGIESTEVFARIRRCLEARVADTMDNEFVFPDGSAGHFELRFEPVPDGVLILSIDVTERRRSQMAARHLHQLLDAVRRVNQLIVKERDPASLAQKACEALVASGSHGAAWIVLDSADGLSAWLAQAGWDASIETFRARVDSGWRPPCCAESRRTRDGVVAIESVHACRGCALAASRSGDGAITAPLRRDGVEYGTLNLRLAHGRVAGADELALVRELADDLGLALHAIQGEREREAYAGLVSGSEDAMALVGRDLTYLGVNPRYARNWGMEPRAMVGLAVRDVVGEEFFRRVVARSVGACFEGRTTEEEIEMELPDAGRTLAFVRVAPNRAPDGSIRAAAITVRDITDQKRTQARLQQSEDRLSVIFHRSPVGIVLSRTSDGYVFDANPAFTAIFGYTPEEVVGRNARELGMWADPGERERYVRQIVETGAYHGPNVRAVHRDGRTLILDLSVEAIRTGTETYSLGVVQDVTEQRQIEDRLRYSETRLSAVIQHGPVGIMLVRLADSAIVEINEAFASMYGYSVEEMVGRTSVELGMWDDPADRAAMLDVLRRDGRVRGVPCRGHRRNGEPIVLRIAIQPVDIEGVPHIIGVAEDVTEHLRAEEQLRESQARLTAIVHRSTLGIVLVRQRDGLMVEVNRAFAEMHGYTVEELQGRSTIDVGIWENPGQRDAVMRELAFRDRLRDLDVRSRAKDGSRRVTRASFERFEFGGEPFTLTIVQDVTDRWRMEQVVQRQDELLRDVASVAKMGGWQLDPATGELLWTPGVAAIHGTQTNSGSSLPEVLSHYTDESRAKLDEAVREATVNGRPYDLLLDLVTPDGDRKRVRSIGHPVFEDGKVVRIWGSLQDITEQVATDAARTKLEEQLRASQKMEAIGTLAGGVAHDFNNLLVVILNYADFALEALHESDPLHHDILEIRKAGERAASLTRQLLAFSRRQVLQPVPMSLNLVIEGLDQMLRRIVGEDIEFTLDLFGDAGVVVADPGQIEQVLMNLVVNARDAMPEGGKLTIATSNVELRPGLRHDGIEVQPGPYVELRVTDVGVGMSHETLERIFEPFFTTKPKGRGTGLGLAMVYGIVKQSGGYIWVDSRLGAGTTVRVQLPRALEAVPAAASAGPAVRRMGSETILLVEDEEALRELVSRMLRAAGYEVITAADGEEALGIAMRRGGDVHLLLTDVVMPRAGGTKVARELARMWPAVKVLYMSGYTDEAIAHHGVDGAAAPLIVKPFNAQDLLARVREVLDGEAPAC